MGTGWTGGQYSLARAMLGLCVSMAAWSHLGQSATLTALAAAGMILGVLLAVGYFDREAAAVLVVLALGAGVQKSIPWHGVTPGLPASLVVTLLLVAHAGQPSAPYGSLARRGKADPGTHWRLRTSIFIALWVVMAVSYTAWGIVMLRQADQAWRMGDALAQMLAQEGRRGAAPQLLQAATWLILGLHLGFAPLALVRRLRPWLWLALLVIDVAFILTFHGQGLRAAMLLLHMFTFDPAWIAPLPRHTEHKREEEESEYSQAHRRPETIFYDGHCGLCHRWVRFVLAEDRWGDTFRFSPLQSRAFEQAVPARQRAELPDSIIVQTAGGELLIRSDAVAYLCKRLGGIWRPIGALVQLLPRFIRDGAYNAVARVRHKIWKRPADVCPMLPPQLRQRFVFDAQATERK